MFLHLSVILSTGRGRLGCVSQHALGRGVCVSQHALGRGVSTTPGADNPQPPGQTPSTPWADTPHPGQTPHTLGRHPPPPTTTAVDGTHPTGIHSCFNVLYWPRLAPQFLRPILAKKWNILIITAHKRSLRRLCFYRCVSVHRGGVPGQVPPRTRCTPGQVIPGTRYTPSGTRYSPLPRTSYTPLQGTRHTPPEQCMLGDTGNMRAVCILLECILVRSMLLFINSTFWSGSP